MPELPEVETIARGLQVLVGREIRSATVHWPRTVGCPSPDEFRGAMAGRQVAGVGRRGKYLVLSLDAGALLIHLKMSGRLRIVAADEPPERHTHIVWDLDDGTQLRFRDARKFGRVYWVEDPAQVTATLGPEPLADSFTLEEFRRLLARRSGRLKSLLLNQQFLAGLGNIYSDEALFAAGLHPLRRASGLSAEEQEHLHGAIRHVLSHAVSGRGTTLSDSGYVDLSGEEGSFQGQIAVYGRTGQPCLRCATPIERLVIGGRSAHVCPTCQKAEEPAGA